MPINGTTHLQSANIRRMDASAALDHLDTLATKNGDNRLRENSLTFTKAKKRTQFRLALNQFKQKICGDNAELKQLWDQNTAKGTNDMTGTQLKSLVSKMRSAVGQQSVTPGQPKHSESEVEVTHEFMEGFYDPPEPEMTKRDEADLQTMVRQHDQQQSVPKQPYARNQSNSFVNTLQQGIGNEQALMDDVRSGLRSESPTQIKKDAWQAFRDCSTNVQNQSHNYEDQAAINQQMDEAYQDLRNGNYKAATQKLDDITHQYG